jgi:hypothetical protein
MAEMTADREHHESDLASQRAELKAGREALASELAQLAMLRAELTADRAELTSLRADLETERAEISALRQRLDAQAARSATVDAMPEAPAADAGDERASNEDSHADEHAASQTARSSDDDVFARLRALSVLRESDDAPPATENEQPQTVAAASPSANARVETPPPAAPVHTAPRGGHDDEEESIDDYMAQLFARLNGARTSSPQTAPTPAAPPPAKPDPTPIEVPVAGPAAESAMPTAATEITAAAPMECEPPLPPLESLATPRRSAPAIDISAMRALANMSATSAIGASQRRQWANSATVKLGAAGALGVTGAVLLLLAKSGWLGHSSVTLFGFGAVLFVAGALWLLQGLGLLLMAWGVRNPKVATPPANELQGANRRINTTTEEKLAAQRAE